MRGRRYEVCCKRCEVRGARSEERRTRCEVRGARYEVRGTSCEVRDLRYEVGGTKSAYDIQDIRYSSRSIMLITILAPLYSS
jgi:hypothetical protein